MKIKLIKIIILSIFCMSFAGCANNKTENTTTKSRICEVEGCEYGKVKNSNGIYEDYCKIHICEVDSCGMLKENDSDLCWLHKLNQISLTDSQIKEVKTIVDSYIKDIMDKNPDILAINLFSDTPKTDDYFIKYRCNVVREDNDTNLATIYVYISDDGTFKVSKLEYDE